MVVAGGQAGITALNLFYCSAVLIRVIAPASFQGRANAKGELECLGPSLRDLRLRNTQKETDKAKILALRITSSLVYPYFSRSQVLLSHETGSTNKNDINWPLGSWYPR